MARPCRICHFNAPDGATSCDRCGASLPTLPSAQVPVSGIAAAVQTPLIYPHLNIELTMASLTMLLTVIYCVWVNVATNKDIGWIDATVRSIAYLAVPGILGLLVAIFLSKRWPRRLSVAAIVMTVFVGLNHGSTGSTVFSDSPAPQTGVSVSEKDQDKEVVKNYYSQIQERAAKLQHHLDDALRPVQYDQPFSARTISTRKRLLEERDKATSPGKDLGGLSKRLQRLPA